MERTRPKVFNYGVENLKAKVVDKIFDQFLYKLRCAGKVNLAFGFSLNTFEDGKFRYFHIHETIPCSIDPNWCAPKTT